MTLVSQVKVSDSGGIGGSGGARSCFRPVVRGDTAICVPCNKLSCHDCRHHIRHRDAERLAEKIGADDKLYLYQVRQRAWIRQKVKKAGGEYVFFPQTNGIFILTNLDMGGEALQGDREEILFELFMSVAPGRRVTTSTGWHFTPLRPAPLPEDLEGQGADPTYECRVSWDEFVAITEDCGFTLKRISAHDGASYYKIEGLAEASMFTEMMWAEKIGKHPVRRRRSDT